jgi:ABC-type transport system, involved in lipoprotein release, permease component
VQDRIKEHAVLQTLGYSGWHIFGFVLSESLLVSLCGGLVGVGLAMLILRTSNLALGTEGILIAFLPSVSLALTGLAVSALVGVFAGLIPAWQASRAEIVPALK